MYNNMNIYTPVETDEIFNTTARFIGNMLTLDYVGKQQSKKFCFTITVTETTGEKDYAIMPVNDSTMCALRMMLSIAFYLNAEEFAESINEAEDGMLGQMTEAESMLDERWELEYLFKAVLSSNISQIEITTGNVHVVLPNTSSYGNACLYNAAILQFVSDVAAENAYTLDIAHKSIYAERRR